MKATEILSQPPNPSAPQFPSNFIKATQILSQPTHRRPRFHTIQAKIFGRGEGSIIWAATLLSVSDVAYEGVTRIFLTVRSEKCSGSSLPA